MHQRITTPHTTSEPDQDPVESMSNINTSTCGIEKGIDKRRVLGSSVHDCMRHELPRVFQVSKQKKSNRKQHLQRRPNRSRLRMPRSLVTKSTCFDETYISLASVAVRFVFCLSLLLRDVARPFCIAFSSARSALNNVVFFSKYRNNNNAPYTFCDIFLMFYSQVKLCPCVLILTIRVQFLRQRIRY